MPEVDSAITPTGLLGHDGSGPGTVTPEAARTLLALVITAAGAPSTSAAFLGQIYVNSSNGDRYEAVDVGNGAADWELQSSLTLTANQYAAADSAGTAQEARTDTRSGTTRFSSPSDGMSMSVRVPFAATLVSVKHRVSGGTTCTCQGKKNGTNTTGFGSPVAMSTSEGSVSVGDSFAAGDYLTVHLATTSGLSADGDSQIWVDITPIWTRTAS